MLFDSLAFLIALPLFSLVFLNAPKSAQPALLLLGSIAACASFGWLSLACVLLITLLGYFFGSALQKDRSSRTLTLGVLSTVAPLLVLKYTNFAMDSLQSALGFAGIGMRTLHINISLPIGLSFYTFVIIGYMVDIYFERVRPEANLLRLTLFTTFYPKLVAGPVERAAHFLPQIEVAKRFDYARVTDGLRIIGSGLFKKLVVADRLSIVVNGVYNDPAAYGGVVLLLTSVCYMFQLYYDFCGYSEIAVGSARVLGFDLVWNFNRPYAARSIADYWRRWHISLTTWLFEYVFAPVAASLRDSKYASIVIAMMITFFASGLWHGAHWTFVAYGLLHGVAMCLYFLSVAPRKRLKRAMSPRLHAVLSWALTFAFIACVDVLFRAASIRDAGTYLYREALGLPPDFAYLAQRHFSVSAIKALIAGLPILKLDLLIAVGAVVCAELVSWLGRNRPFREQLSGQAAWVRWPAYYLLVGSILYLGSQNSATTFIYMKF